MVAQQTAQDMFECLVKHGCTNLTSSTNMHRSSSAVVAYGGFGDVRRMVMNDGTIVAIKTLRLHILLKDNDKAMKVVSTFSILAFTWAKHTYTLQRAVREVHIWSKLRHVNIQQLLGIIIFDGALGMVSLWRERGNLQQYIAAKPDVERYSLVCPVQSLGSMSLWLGFSAHS